MCSVAPSSAVRVATSSSGSVVREVRRSAQPDELYFPVKPFGQLSQKADDDLLLPESARANATANVTNATAANATANATVNATVNATNATNATNVTNVTNATAEPIARTIVLRHQEGGHPQEYGPMQFGHAVGVNATGHTVPLPNRTANATANATTNVTANVTANATNGTGKPIVRAIIIHSLDGGLPKGYGPLRFGHAVGVNATGHTVPLENVTANTTSNVTVNTTANATANVTVNATANASKNETGNITANVTFHNVSSKVNNVTIVSSRNATRVNATKANATNATNASSSEAAEAVAMEGIINGSSGLPSNASIQRFGKRDGPVKPFLPWDQNVLRDWWKMDEDYVHDENP